jgi:hypothetical protein
MGKIFDDAVREPDDLFIDDLARLTGRLTASSTFGCRLIDRPLEGGSSPRNETFQKRYCNVARRFAASVATFSGSAAAVAALERSL